MERRRIIALAAFTALTLVACGNGDEDPAQPGGPDSTGSTGDSSGSIGLIVFNRGEPGTGNAVTYTVNPDGSAEQQLFLEGGSEGARWSPDGTEIHIFCCSDGMVAHFLDPSTGELRALEPPDPAVELFCGGAWTPDGERVACEGYGVEDPSRNGIYWVRSSDGGSLEQITSNPDGEDIPNGDFSPDGNRLVFVRAGENGQAGIFVVGAYSLIAFWQFNQACWGGEGLSAAAKAACYPTRDPFDLAIISASFVGALVGFLWWNAPKAKVFMGDVGSMSIGGVIAAMAILTRTELLAVLVAGVFIIGPGSVILQRLYFKITRGKRLFLMSPFHHHLELRGWSEVTIVVRMWIIAGLLAVSGVGFFYVEWLSRT